MLIMICCLHLSQEVNSLQWELSFNQIQMIRSQQSWEQKYNRLDLLHIHSCVCCISIGLYCNIIVVVVVVIRILNENKTLTDTLEGNESQIQQLRAENSGK